MTRQQLSKFFRRLRILSRIKSFTYDTLFEYDTPKYVTIKDKRVGLTYNFISLVIIGYIFGYALIYNKGYQETEAVTSVVTTKVKGASLTNNMSSAFSNNCEDDSFPNPSVLDTADLVVPPLQPNSFFVATNIWVTCNQIRSICNIQDGTSESIFACNETTPCNENELVHGKGVLKTGECDNNTGTCDVYGWCPLQNIDRSIFEKNGPNIDTKNFTVYIKNTITFPTLDPSFQRRNVPNSYEYLTRCLHSAEEKDCPIFTLEHIVYMHNNAEGHYDELATKGGVVDLRIEWNCDLDRSPKHCKPQYSAKRLDTHNSDISQGFNFMFPKHYQVNGTEHRDLWRVNGILFKVEVVGQGGKFSFTRVLLVIGSAIGLLAIASIITDVIALHLLREGKHYKDKKFQSVDKAVFRSKGDKLKKKDDGGSQQLEESTLNDSQPDAEYTRWLTAAETD